MAKKGTNLATLSLNIVAGTAEFNKDIDKAKKKLKGFRRTTKETGKSIAGFANSMKTAAVAAVALIAAMGAGKAKNFVNNTLQGTLALQNQSLFLNETITNVNELSRAYELVGGTLENAADALATFQERTAEAKAGTGELFAFFKEQNLSLSELSADSPLGQFKEFVELVGSLDSASQIRGFRGVLGDSAGDLTAMALRQGEFNKAFERMGKLGPSASKALNDAARETFSFNAATAELKRTWEDFARSEIILDGVRELTEFLRQANRFSQAFTSAQGSREGGYVGFAGRVARNATTSIQESPLGTFDGSRQFTKSLATEIGASFATYFTDRRTRPLEAQRQQLIARPQDLD